jgi:hypothetical protein
MVSQLPGRFSTEFQFPQNNGLEAKPNLSATAVCPYTIKHINKYILHQVNYAKT